MKIGIYGGSFDPPHIGHINACKTFFEAYDFDKLFVIPVAIPPHKTLKSSVSTEDRLNMSRLAFGTISDKVEISDLEIKRQGKSYTADTIRHFKENYSADIYFLCGTDMILTLDMWYKPDYIFENATIVYMRRECDPEITKQLADKILEYKQKYNAKIDTISAEVIAVSSTIVRNTINEESVKKYLPYELYEYIKNNNLY